MRALRITFQLAFLFATSVSCSQQKKAETATDASITDDEKARFRVALEFEGNENLSALDLRTALSALMADLTRSGVDEAAVEDAVYELRAYYVDEGFPDPIVRGVHSRKGPDSFEIRFQIVEGRRRYLDGLSLAGNTSIEDSELESCFVWRQEGTFGSLAKYVLGIGSRMLGLERAVYTESALRAALDCVEAVYRLEGFYFVRTSFVASERQLGSVEVKVTIEEGPRVKLKRPVEIVGAKAISVQALREVLGLEEESLFVPRLPLVLKGRVLDHYRTHGYLAATVDVERRVVRDPPEAQLRLVVREGPLIRVRGLDVVGNDNTWDSVIDRYVELRPSEVWDSEKVRRTTRGLLRSGLFESVSVDPAEIEGDEEHVDLIVTVKEKPRYRVGFLGGWGAWEQLRGGVVLENTNVLGSGHRAAIEASGSFRHGRVEGDYSIPYVYDDAVSFDASSFFEIREHPSYTTREVGAEPGFGIRLTDNFRTRVFHSVRQSEVKDVEGSVPLQLQEDVFVSGLNLALLFDDRSSFVNPADGSSQRFRLEYASEAFGSELGFLRPTISSTFILPVWKRLRFVVGAEAGAIFRMEGTDSIPLQERFFSGGETSIRSFSQDDAGPKSGGDPIGGEAFLTLHAEFRQPLELVPMLEGLDAAIFVDAGTVNLKVDDFGGGRWLFGVGFGLRYNTPIGPVRADFGFNPDREPREDLFVFHFGLGYPF